LRQVLSRAREGKKSRSPGQRRQVVSVSSEIDEQAQEEKGNPTSSKKKRGGQADWGKDRVQIGLARWATGKILLRLKGGGGGEQEPGRRDEEEGSIVLPHFMGGAEDKKKRALYFP